MWRHSPHSVRIFGLEQKVIQIIYNKDYGEDVRQVFKLEEMFTSLCLFILHIPFLAFKKIKNLNN